MEGQMAVHCDEHTDKCEVITEALSSAKSAHHRLDGHDGAIDDHGKRINNLELSDVAHGKDISTVCRQMSNLTKAIWALVCLGLGAGVGFTAWAVQQLVIKGGTP
jgi:hypothetical protein